MDKGYKNGTKLVSGCCKNETITISTRKTGGNKQKKYKKV